MVGVRAQVEGGCQAFRFQLHGEIVNGYLQTLNRNLEKDYDMGDLESRISANSKAPRVTEADVLASIGSCYFVTAYEAAEKSKQHRATQTRNNPYGDDIPEELQVVTLAIVTTKTGFTVIGVSGCADPKNFNAEIGQEIAKRNAVSQLWGHMGFELRTKLHELEVKEKEARELGVMARKEAEQDYSAPVPHGIGIMDE